jgi:hypothetical protein
MAFSKYNKHRNLNALFSRTYLSLFRVKFLAIGTECPHCLYQRPSILGQCNLPTIWRSSNCVLLAEVFLLASHHILQIYHNAIFSSSARSSITFLCWSLRSFLHFWFPCPNYNFQSIVTIIPYKYWGLYTGVRHLFYHRKRRRNSRDARHKVVRRTLT